MDPVLVGLVDYMSLIQLSAQGRAPLLQHLRHVFGHLVLHVVSQTCHWQARKRWLWKTLGGRLHPQTCAVHPGGRVVDRVRFARGWVEGGRGRLLLLLLLSLLLHDRGALLSGSVHLNVNGL